MEIIEEGLLKTFNVNCHCCKSKLEYTIKDIETGRHDLRDFIICPVCSRSVTVKL